jgi:hypothetical protein
MTIPPSPDARRMTWVDSSGTTWRVERIAGRWSLSRYSPDSDTWTRVGSYPSRIAAVSAAYGEENQR